MTTIDFKDFKIRFDPKEVRISIDGDLIDVGARSIEEIDSLKEEIKRIKSHIPVGNDRPVKWDDDNRLIRLDDGTYMDPITQTTFIKMRKLNQ